MKKIVLALITMFLLSTLLHSPTSVKADSGDITVGDNLFSNASFEDGSVELFSNVYKESFNNWTQVSWCNVDSGLGFARTGNSNIYMTLSYSGLGLQEYPTIYQDVYVEPETYYEFSFYVKKWGESDTNNIWFGYRDIYNGDPWAQVEEKIASGIISEDYQKVSGIFYSRNYEKLRFAVFTSSIEYNGEDGGFHLDDFSLKKVAQIESATFDVDENMMIGKTTPCTVTATLSNGVTITNKECSDIKTQFTSSDESVIVTDLEGSLIPINTGSASISAKVSFNGSIVDAGTKEITIDESAKPSDLYIKNISLMLTEKVSFTQFAEIDYSIFLSDGTMLEKNLEEISIASSDSSIIYAQLNGVKAQVIGVSNGTSDIYITVNHSGYSCVGSISVSMSSDNLIKDPSFECVEDNSQWTIESNCGTGIDSGLLNGLSHTGYANFWMMAPIYWNADVKNTSTVIISQNVYLTEGDYDLSAYINRFFATGIDGTLPSVGGIVKLGAIKINTNGSLSNDNQFNEFDISYGWGGFQKISTLLRITEDGLYRVYYRVDGDEEMGLGMQLDDMYLYKAVYPVSISAYILDDNFGVDDLTYLYVEATYQDGSTELISTDVRIIPDDYHVLYVSNGFLIGREPGTTKVKVIANILSRKYETELEIKVAGGRVEPQTPPSENDKTGCNSAFSSNSVFTLSIVLIGFMIVTIKKRRGGIKYEN